MKPDLHAGRRRETKTRQVTRLVQGPAWSRSTGADYVRGDVFVRGCDCKSSRPPRRARGLGAYSKMAQSKKTHRPSFPDFTTAARMVHLVCGRPSPPPPGPPPCALQSLLSVSAQTGTGRTAPVKCHQSRAQRPTRGRKHQAAPFINFAGVRALAPTRASLKLAAAKIKWRRLGFEPCPCKGMH